MADVGSPKNWLVSETPEVEKKWIESQIQEKVSRIKRIKQDIEDFNKGMMPKLEGTIMMLDLEILRLVQKMNNVGKDNAPDKDTIIEAEITQ